MGFFQSTPSRALLLALLLVTRTVALTQQYCSSENTGSDSTPMNSIYQSNGRCFTYCQDNYAFAVVQWQNCWCSNYIPADQLSVSECNQECPGYGYEDCGNQGNGLFGYVALTRSPSGTAGSSSPTTSPDSSTSPTSSPQTSSPATTESSTQTQVGSPSPTSSSTSFSTISSTTSTPASTVNSIVTEAPTSDSSSSSVTPTPVTNTQIVTISGAVITQTVTSTPRPTISSGSDQISKPVKQSSNNTGAIVGGVIGGVAGLLLIAAIAFFFWRRRGNDRQSSSTPSKLDRNASILSRSGLLGSGRAAAADPEKSIHEHYGAQRNSTLYHEGGGSSPSSGPAAGYDRSDSLGRRNSKPLVYDQRLNPAALMENWQQNGSRSSINTIQDQRDYSRPLGVTNPDPAGDD